MRRVAFNYKYWSCIRLFQEDFTQISLLRQISKTQHLLEDTFFFLYLAFMKLVYPLICVLLFSGCAARTINNNHARDVIIDIPQGALEKEDVDVVKLSRIGGSEAIAETQLKTAFRLEKVNGQWIVREIKLGHGQWEKIGNLSEALDHVKIEETNAMLDRIAEAIKKYRESTGNLPAFKDYIALSDQLAPQYLTPLIRLDSWRRPLDATHSDGNTILVCSAGPDGKFRTSDDLCKTISK
jgi:hypothetical protein